MARDLLYFTRVWDIRYELSYHRPITHKYNRILDTDSLIYKLETDDMYEDMLQNSKHYDLSVYKGTFARYKNDENKQASQTLPLITLSLLIIFLNLISDTW